MKRKNNQWIGNACCLAVMGFIALLCFNSCTKENGELIGDCYIMHNNQRVGDTIYWNEIGTTIVFNVDESELKGNTEYSSFEWRTFFYDEKEKCYKPESNVTFYDSGSNKGFEVSFNTKGLYKVQCVMDYSNDVYTKKIAKHVYVIVQ